ncbi:MAG: OsmC family protein [Candidatus Heimdallarchaeaceae archaeon]|jgi:organic hydroperoxide reductase OsmC/OhrA
MTDETVFEYEINLIKKEEYKYEVDFGKETISKLHMDEMKHVPGGEETGPNASMLLAAAVGNCLSASLTFCLSKKKVELKELRTKVIFKRKRNEDGFWRISNIIVKLDPVVENKDDANFLRCLEIFKQYCIVAGSVESGIPIQVELT